MSVSTGPDSIWMAHQQRLERARQAVLKLVQCFGGGDWAAKALNLRNAQLMELRRARPDEELHYECLMIANVLQYFESGTPMLDTLKPQSSIFEKEIRRAAS